MPINCYYYRLNSCTMAAHTRQEVCAGVVADCGDTGIEIGVAFTLDDAIAVVLGCILIELHCHRSWVLLNGAHQGNGAGVLCDGIHAILEGECGFQAATVAAKVEFRAVRHRRSSSLRFSSACFICTCILTILDFEVSISAVRVLMVNSESSIGARGSF